MTIFERSRFAFDLGTNSLGWAVYRLDRQGRPCELMDCGVRLFSDGRNPKDGQSLAVMRRTPRAARRRRDRFIQRRTWLMALLVRHGLMPEVEADRKALEGLDVYAIRGRALDARLEPFEIGRALFHMNQRRGYQSNRIADARAEDDKDKGKIASAGERLEGALGDRTLGQYYAALQTGPVRERKGVRARINGEGAKAFYDVYPQRDMLKDEFDRLWSHQATHHPGLMIDDARDAIRQAIFHQRPLRPPVVGRCTFFPDETRVAEAHPLAQRFRIYQELANLAIETGLERPRPLTLAERDLLAAPLLEGNDLTFSNRAPFGIRKLLDLGGAEKINLQKGGRDRITGDASAHRLGGTKGALKRIWPRLSDDTRGEIIEQLLTADDPDALKGRLVELGATPDEAEDAARFVPPQGHLRVGPTFARGVVAAMKAGDAATGQVVRYHDAVRRAFPHLHHSDLRTGEVYDRLPDYRTALERHTVGGTGNPDDADDKRYGRVPNPTVHIGLNQLRRVTNALIDRHGPPTEVVLELARELKQNKDDKDRAQKQNRENEAANRRRTADLEAAGLNASPANLRLYRLWEDLGPMPRVCTYTGKTMSFADVFSDRVEIEHILPFSKTLDDSMANRTLAFREANRQKRNFAPEQAFSGPEYEAIQQRADALPRNKAWRFKPGAMEKYEKEERGFLDRQLNETRHLSKLAREYMAPLVNHEEDENHVWVVTGQLTAMLRARWGLNFSNVKDRNNHRHHAIDAATIGVIDRGLLQEMARRAGAREEEDDLNAITKDVPEPPGFVAANRIFRENVRERVLAVIVSHKAEHGTGGALHEDTAYGLVRPNPNLARPEDGNLVYRKALDALTDGEVARIRDLKLRADLANYLAGTALRYAAKGKANADWREAMRAYGAANSIRRVRLLKKEKEVVKIRDRLGNPYKAVIPEDNHHMDIVEDMKGVWRGYAVTRFDANQMRSEPVWISEVPGARLIMRLHKGDLVELRDKDGDLRIKRIVSINPSERRFFLADHDEGGELQKRHDDKEDHFRWDLAAISKLKARGFRQFKVNEIGQGRDVT